MYTNKHPCAMHDDTLIYFGGSVKVLGESDGEVKVGGPLVVFGGSDLQGEFFTADTYFGAQLKASDTAVLDTMFNHGIATSDELKALAQHEFQPLTAKKTDTGIMAEVILRQRNDYEALLAEMAKKGKLGWSSGSAPHAVQKTESGEIKRWPLIEGSLTHQPAEPRTTAMPLKALMGGEDEAEGIIKSLRQLRATPTLAASIRNIRRTIKA